MTAWADVLAPQHDEAAGWAGVRLDIAKRCAAGDAIPLARGVGGPAEKTFKPQQSLRYLRAGFARLGHRANHLPDFFVDLQVFNILRQIIQPSNQVPRVDQCGENGLPHAGGHTEPGLFTDRYQHTVFHLFDLDGYGGFSTAGGTRAGCDLYSHFVAAANRLCAQVAVIKIGQQSFCDVCGVQITVIDSLFHSFDYNHLR